MTYNLIQQGKHTSVVCVSIDYIQKGNFGKSWFPEAPFGWRAAVTRHIVLLLYLNHYHHHTATDSRYVTSYISLSRTGQGLYSESDPPSLCLLKPFVSPESK